MRTIAIVLIDESVVAALAGSGPTTSDKVICVIFFPVYLVVKFVRFVQREGEATRVAASLRAILSAPGAIQTAATDDTEIFARHLAGFLQNVDGGVTVSIERIIARVMYEHNIFVENSNHDTTAAGWPVGCNTIPKIIAAQFTCGRVNPKAIMAIRAPIRCESQSDENWFREVDEYINELNRALRLDVCVYNLYMCKDLLIAMTSAISTRFYVTWPVPMSQFMR